jgi:hypothetical protein
MRVCARGIVLASLLGCSASEPPRTVSGVSSLVLQQDDGTQTSVPDPNLNVIAAWAPTGSIVSEVLPMGPGYVRLPASTQPDGGFAVEGVPQGPYFLQVDEEAHSSTLENRTYLASFYPFVSSSPDLSWLMFVGRPDAVVAQSGVDFTLSVDGLKPWNPTAPPGLSGWFYRGDLLEFFGTQINTWTSMSAGLAAGATNASKRLFFNGLPDASKGDFEYVLQFSTSPIGSGATLGQQAAVSRFARLELTVPDGTTATQSVTLADAPQTGSFNTRLAASKWAPLIRDSNPAMVPVPGGQVYRIIAFPDPLAFPNHTGETFPIQLASVMSPPLLDVDYGTLSYGQVLAPAWHEVREVMLVASTDASNPYDGNFVYWSQEAMPAAGDAVPLIGPARSPKIQGLDAFQPQSGVGLTPVISWSPPRVGTPTSYIVYLFAASGTPRYVGLTFTLYGATSLQVPPGFLEKGSTYQLVIDSFLAPWDTLGRAPRRTGVPFARAETVAAVFSP